MIPPRLGFLFPFGSDKIKLCIGVIAWRSLKLKRQREGIFAVKELILYSNFSLFSMQALNCSL